MKTSVWILVFLLLATVVFAHDGVSHMTPQDEFDHATATNSSTLPLGVLKIIEYRNQLAASITFLAALLAGIISFTSPCGFVLLPTFFTILFKERKKAVMMTSLFTLGMMIGFILLGIAAAFAGTFINQYRGPFAIFSGLIFILFGFLLLFNKGFGTFHPKLLTKKPWGLVLFGFAFAFGWSPCIGPVLGGILLLAATTGSVLQGAIMLAFFALGVGIPLIIIAALSDKFDWARWTGKTLKIGKYEIHTFNLISAAILITIGAIMVWWRGTSFIELTVTRFIPWSMTAFYAMNDSLTNTPFFTSTAAQVLGVILGLALLGGFIWILRKRDV